MATDDRNDPYSAFRFKVTIDNNIGEAAFSECSGLTTETDAIEYRTGSDEITVRKLPGLRKFSNITLKRGYTSTKNLWEWRKKVMDGKTERAGGSIVLLNEAGGTGLTWTFSNGWPRKWEGPTFNAKNNEVAIETLEIVVEDIALA